MHREGYLEESDIVESRLYRGGLREMPVYALSCTCFPRSYWCRCLQSVERGSGGDAPLHLFWLLTDKTVSEMPGVGESTSWLYESSVGFLMNTTARPSQQ